MLRKYHAPVKLEAMIIVFVPIFLLIALCFLSVSKTKDILNPVIIFSTPFIFSLTLHSLQLSDFYVHNDTYLPIIITYMIPVSLSFGLCTPLLFCSFSSNVKFNIVKCHHSGYGKKIWAAVILFFGTFLIEAFIFGLPLFSDSPTKAYGSYGLSFLHHLTTMAYVAIAFSILTLNLGKTSKINVLIVLLLALITFVPILARMQVLNLFIILLFANYYFYNWSAKRILFLSGVIIICFVGLFLYIGWLRAGATDAFDYFDRIAKINCDCLGPFSIIYLYSSVSLQNTINLVANNDSYSYGLFTILSMVPKLDPVTILNSDPSSFRASPGLTTFTYGSILFLDFGVFSLLFNTLTGIVISISYLQFRAGSLLYMIIYLCGLVRSLLFGFFSDTLYTTSLVVIVIFAITFSYRYVFKITNAKHSLQTITRYERD